MLVMTYTDARANFATLLNKVKSDGAAIIKRADGSRFRVTVDEQSDASPFDGIRSLPTCQKAKFSTSFTNHASVRNRAPLTPAPTCP